MCQKLKIEKYDYLFVVKIALGLELLDLQAFQFNVELETLHLNRIFTW